MHIVQVSRMKVKKCFFLQFAFLQFPEDVSFSAGFNGQLTQVLQRHEGGSNMWCVCTWCGDSLLSVTAKAGTMHPVVTSRSAYKAAGFVDVTHVQAKRYMQGIIYTLQHVASPSMTQVAAQVYSGRVAVGDKLANAQKHLT